MPPPLELELDELELEDEDEVLDELVELLDDELEELLDDELDELLEDELDEPPCPFNSKFVGIGGLPPGPPMNPTDTELPGAIVPFQPTSFMV